MADEWKYPLDKLEDGAMKSVRENTRSQRKRPPKAVPAPPSADASPALDGTAREPQPQPQHAPARPPNGEAEAPPTMVETVDNAGGSAGANADKSTEGAGDEAAWAYEVAPAEASADLTPVVGKNLRRLRVKRGLSLERLARASSVSRAMLGQIELGQSTPTINVLWKIARALGVPFSALITNRAAGRTTVMSAERAKILTSHDGTFTSRALFPFDEPRTVEFYELRLSPLSVEQADPHPPGTVENLVVTRGALEMTVGAEQHVLSTGDAIMFEADVPHTYRNPGEVEVVMYLVMTYADKAG